MEFKFTIPEEIIVTELEYEGAVRVEIDGTSQRHDGVEAAAIYIELQLADSCSGAEAIIAADQLIENMKTQPPPKPKETKMQFLFTIEEQISVFEVDHEGTLEVIIDGMTETLNNKESAAAYIENRITSNTAAEAIVAANHLIENMTILTPPQPDQPIKPSHVYKHMTRRDMRDDDNSTPGIALHFMDPTAKCDQENHKYLALVKLQTDLKTWQLTVAHHGAGEYQTITLIDMDLAGHNPLTKSDIHATFAIPEQAVKSACNVICRHTNNLRETRRVLTKNKAATNLQMAEALKQLEQTATEYGL